MFDPVFESLRSATESTSEVQREMFKKWGSTWPGFPPSGAEQVLKFQKKWADIVGDLVEKQRESFQAHFDAACRTIDESFRLSEARDVEELRNKTIELWQKNFDCQRQASEAQVREFQRAVIRCTEVMMKSVAYCWATS